MARPVSIQFADCPLMLGIGQTGACNRCAKPLTGRRTTWCSDECADWWQQNHWMTQARYAAHYRSQVWELPYRTVVAGEWVGRDYDASGMRVDLYALGPHFRDHGKRPIGHVCELCDAIVYQFEVDHIEPANGTHSVASCLHHADNLRVVCVPCHRARTKAQAAERAAARRGTRRLIG